MTASSRFGGKFTRFGGSLVERRKVEKLGVQFFFQCEGFGDEDFFFDMGVNAKVLFEGLELGQEDPVKGFVGLGWLVEANGLADVFQLIFGVVVFAHETVDGIIAAGDDEGGKMSRCFAGIAGVSRYRAGAGFLLSGYVRRDR